MDKQMQNLLSDEDKNRLLNRLGLSSSTEEEKDKAISEFTERIMTRIAYCLVEEDVNTLEELNKGGANAQAIKYFLLSKIPNLEKILAEEIEDFKNN